MAIEYKRSTAIFSGIIAVDDAQELFEWLQKRKNPKINLLECTHLHTADLQVIMALKPEVVKWPEDKSLDIWLRNILTDK